MEQILPIRYTSKALQDIDLIEQFITSKGHPETAVSYSACLLTFVKTITFLPFKNIPCKYPPFAKRRFYFAVFERTFVIAYRAKPDAVEIMRVVHGKRLVD